MEALVLGRSPRGETDQLAPNYSTLDTVLMQLFMYFYLTCIALDYFIPHAVIIIRMDPK